MKMIEIDNISYKKLSEILTIKNGKDYKSHSKGNVPVYGSGGIISYIDTAVYDKPSVLIPRKGSLDKLYFVDTPFWNVDTIFYTEINTKLVEPRYLYHYLKQAHLEKLNKAGGVPSLTQAVLNNLTIPLPPLPIQQEIVRILDTFTNFTAELTDKLNAELTARRKQYEYYRDELLKTGEQVSLYEVAQYSKDRILASELTDENYVGVDNLLPNKQGKIKSEHTPIEGKFTGFVKGDILIGNIRPYLKKIWFSDCVGGTNGDVLTIRVIDKERVLPRFLYFALSTESFFNYDMNNAKGAKMPRGDKNAVMKYQFYLPSLGIQEQVVSILEIFDNLCNGLECGLPAEIYARQQQYEYYRDKLLNFKELHNKED